MMSNWKPLIAFLAGLALGIIALLNIAYAASPALDGAGTAIKNFGTWTSATVTLTTTLTDDVVCVATYIAKFPSGPRPAISSVTGASLTWTARGTPIGADWGTVWFTNKELWCAPAPSALVAQVITVNFSTATEVNLIAFGVNGVFSTAAPFDSNVSVPASNTGASGTITVSGVSTTQSNDFILFHCGDQSASNCSAPASYTSIGTNTNDDTTAVASYLAVSAPLSSSSITTASRSNWTAVVDALTADSAVSGVAVGSRLLRGVGR